MRTKSSVLRSGGLGAPSLTATPMPARAKSTRRPTTLPCLIRSSITGGLAVTTSAGIDLLHHVALLTRDHLVTARALEAGREIADAGDIALGAEHKNL